MRVMGLHWEMVHLKGAGRAVLRDYTVSVFERHVDYLLGDDCWLIGEANSTMVGGPSWELLMKCELELRKWAVRRVNEGGKTLAEAMEEAWHSIEHRTNYFIAPLAMPHSRISSPQAAAEPRGSKRPADDSTRAHEEGAASRPSPGKGKSKGKDKGGKQKSGSAEKQLKKMTPQAAYRTIRNAPARYKVQMKGSDGAPRCHHFQVGKCSISGCKYSHSCVRCGGAHGVTRCPELGLDQQ